MSLDNLAKMTGIPIVGGARKKKDTFDSLIEVQKEIESKRYNDPLNYWPKIKIMFSTEVNALANNKFESQKISNFNKDNYMSILLDCIKNTNTKFNSNEKIESFSVSNMNGCYVSNSGQAYMESSYSIEILGLNDLIGYELALNIKESFKQESVMFCVGNTNKLV